MSKRPTIAELEAILAQPDGTYQIEVLPNGEVRAAKTASPVIEEIAAERRRQIEEHDGEGTVTLRIEHVRRLLALAGLSWDEAYREICHGTGRKEG